MAEKEVIETLEEGISMEEVPTLTNIGEMIEILDRVEMDDEVRQELVKRLKHLRRETIRHSATFNDFLDEVMEDE